MTKRIDAINIHPGDSPTARRARHMDIEKRLEATGEETVRSLLNTGGLPTVWNPIILSWLAGDRLRDADMPLEEAGQKLEVLGVRHSREVSLRDAPGVYYLRPDENPNSHPDIKGMVQVIFLNVPPQPEHFAHLIGWQIATQGDIPAAPGTAYSVILKRPDGNNQGR